MRLIHRQMLYYLAHADELTCCVSVLGPIGWPSRNRPKNQHMILQERPQSTTMHCTYLLALSESLRAFRARAHWRMPGSRAIFMPTDVLSRSPCLRVLLAQKWFAVLSVAHQAQGAHHVMSGISAKLPNKIQCFCGRFCRLGRSRSVLLPALASQGLAARICLKSARFCLKHFIFSTGRKAKNDIKGTFSSKSAAESRRVCNADLLPQLSSPPNPT